MSGHSDSVGSLALSSCHILSFTVGTQLPRMTFSQSPAVPVCPQYFSFTCALPHPACALISTMSLDLSNTVQYLSVSNGAHGRLRKPPLVLFSSFYDHQPPGQMLHPQRNMSTIGETDKIRGTIPSYHASMHKQVRLTLISEETSLIMR